MCMQGSLWSEIEKKKKHVWYNILSSSLPSLPSSLEYKTSENDSLDSLIILVLQPLAIWSSIEGNLS